VIAGRERAIVVPQAAVMQNEGGRFVWVVADGKALQRQVRTGAWIGTDWAVLDGLKAGDKVIVDNLVRLRPGAAVVLK
jgi:membrane fusion protein (multidrug efflux system)